jgi:hypothetical protein
MHSHVQLTSKWLIHVAKSSEALKVIKDKGESIETHKIEDAQLKGQNKKMLKK